MARQAIHGQRKQKFTLSITPQGVEMLDTRAKALGISKSELIERVARNYPVSIPEEKAVTPEQQLLGERLPS